MHILVETEVPGKSILDSMMLRMVLFSLSISRFNAIPIFLNPAWHLQMG